MTVSFPWLLRAFGYLKLSAKVETFPGKERPLVGITLLLTESENGRRRGGEKQRSWVPSTSLWSGPCFYRSPAQGSEKLVVDVALAYLQ